MERKKMTTQKPCAHDVLYLTESRLHDFWKSEYEKIQWTDNNNISLYVHYPWCRSLCKYCVFGSYNYNLTDKNFINRYENALLRSIENMDDIISSRDVYEIYFGGGTASLWSFENEIKIPTIISNYDKIKRRISETHPYELTKERIDFMINKMKFNVISIGIESFDRDACISQHRIPADIDKLKEAVNEIRANGVYINMDIVAMFNGDEEKNWDIFKRDLQIAADVFHPDTLSTSPNYKSSDYYGISIKFREILREFHDKYPEYRHERGDSIYSTNYEDIIAFSGDTYKFHLADYEKAMISNYYLRDDMTQHEIVNNDIVIGFGGYKNCQAISRTPTNRVIRSYYNPFDDEFIHELTNEDMNSYRDAESEEDLYSKVVRIGTYSVPPPIRRN